MMEIMQQQASLTKEVVTRYFEGINKGGWENHLADDMVFGVFDKEIRGKQAYVSATRRFLQVAKQVVVRRLIIEGESAAAIARYKLVPPIGATSAADVAEFFTVKNGKIMSNNIFFDTTAFNAFLAPFIAQYYKEQL